MKPAHSAGQENLHPQLQLWLQLVHLKRKWGKSTPLCSTKVRRNLANKPWCSSVWQAEQSLLSLTVGSVPMEVPWTVMRISKENIHILYGSDSQGMLRGRTMDHYYRPTFKCQQCLRGKKRESGAAGQPCCSRTGLHFHLLPTMALGTQNCFSTHMFILSQCLPQDMNTRSNILRLDWTENEQAHVIIQLSVCVGICSANIP